MFIRKKINYIAVLLLLFRFSASLYGQNNEAGEGHRQSVVLGVELLERYFGKDKSWHTTNPETGESVRELINFIQKKPIDSVLHVLDNNLADSTFRYVFRLSEHVPDSLLVPGYFSAENINQAKLLISERLRRKYYEEDLAVPVNLVSGIEEKAGALPPEQGYRLIDMGVLELPDSLKLPDVIPDSLMQSQTDFRRFLKLDSIKHSFIEQKRLAYNDSVVNAYRDSIIEDYRVRMYEEEFQRAGRYLTDSVKFNNYQILKEYNENIMESVNDSIVLVLAGLAGYADYIDTTSVTMTNLLGEESTVLLRNGEPYFSMVWLKNEQNDSLRLNIKTTGKRSAQLLIDDGVTFSRFRPKETVDFDFSTLNKGVSGLTGVKQRYMAYIPWRIGGDGSIGFTQTYLENWKQGGQSALSLQIILKGHANWSRWDNKIKWENSAEIRNGYIRPGGEGAETQKNDDKFEITSRLGVSAFKKWYYSSEINFMTQMFNGYKYPTSANPDPISGFLSPGRTFLKVGLDYKPHNNFSLFVSPVTAKNVFVKDTLKVNQKNFGIESGKRSYWEPGLNTDIFWRKIISKQVTYDTKFKMFINYTKPSGNFDFNWENNLVVQLTNRINMRLLIHFIYDEKVLFPVTDANGNALPPKPKLQIREFATIGFSYRVNKQVTRSRQRE